MPQALPAIAAAAGAAIASAGITAAVIWTFVINAGLTYLALALQKKPRDDGPPPVNVTVNGTVEFRRVILGKKRAGATAAFYRVNAP